MPELLLDPKKCLRNIEKMVQKACSHGLSFRPHCKTHQSAEIASWFMDFGVSKITVSSFQMAAYFAGAGWEDILVAFPFEPGQMRILKGLAEKIHLSILIDSPEILPYLDSLKNRVSFYADIDTGYGRTGVKARDTRILEQLIGTSKRNKNLNFSGFYCHAGHSYKTTDAGERDAIHHKACTDLSMLKEQFSAFEPQVLYGDTPNCSTQNTFSGIDELTPGNFVFYDLMQSSLGACTKEDIAVLMSCPVAGRYPEQKRLLIHGGAVHFSKESMEINGIPVFGQMAELRGKSWAASADEQHLHQLSQEHGILENCGDWMDGIRPGERLGFLPVHSCLTAHLMREYKTTDGRIISTLNS